MFRLVHLAEVHAAVHEQSPTTEVVRTCSASCQGIEQRLNGNAGNGFPVDVQIETREIDTGSSGTQCVDSLFEIAVLLTRQAQHRRGSTEQWFGIDRIQCPDHLIIGSRRVTQVRADTGQVLLIGSVGAGRCEARAEVVEPRRERQLVG